MRSLPSLPVIVKARFVSARAEYVFLVESANEFEIDLVNRKKIKEAGGVVKIIA